MRIEEKVVRDPESGEEEVLSRREMVASHFLVQLREDRAEAELAAQAAALGAAVRPHPSRRGLYFLELPDVDLHDYSKILAAFEEDSSLVRYAEPDYIVRTFQTFPDDALFDQLWGMNNTGQSGGNTDSDIDAPEGWAIRNDAATVIVAVIDTGVRYTHEDLAGNMWINPGETSGNGVDDDSNGYVDDVFGFNAINGSGNPIDNNEHGTHVAGTIGAVGNNGVGVAGVAWDVQLMALKFLSAGGSGSVGNAIECIDYGIAMGAHIMNNSWGGGGFSQALINTIEDARQAGILFVAAAGNDSSDLETNPTYPAAYSHDNLISVASMTRNESLSSFSNFGEVAADIAAPGSSILSCDFIADSAYQQLSGTSMATPHISGLLAVLKAEFPSEDYLTLINRLYGGGDTLSVYEGRMRTGRRANLHRALLVNPVLEYPSITAPLGDQVVAEGQSVTLSVTASGAAPLAYEWSKDGQAIGGADESTLEVSNVSGADDGLYRVAVANAAGETTSTGRLEVSVANAALGDAVDAPSLFWVTSGDADWLVDTGESFTGEESAASGLLTHNERSRLSASVTGPGTVSFYWKVSSEKNWDFLRFFIGGQLQVSISGEVDWEMRTLEVPPGSQTLEWTYTKDTSVSIGDDKGWVDSVLFAFNGVAPPSIISQPMDIAVLTGTQTSFSVTAAGTEPLTYEWRKDGLALQIPSADSDTLVLQSASADDSGEYTVVVSNEAGEVTSAPATLTVDTVVRPPFITVPPQSLTVDAGDDVTFTVQSGGTSPFQYQWQKDGVDISGATDATLSLSSVTIADADDYTVTVSNSAGNDLSQAATLTVFDATLAPNITKHPSSHFAFSGEDVTFGVEATGEGILAYQWRKDGIDLTDPSAQTVTLSVVGVDLGDNGNYSVEVSNEFGVVMSDPATLTVLLADASLGEGADNAELTWGTSGDASWSNQTGFTYDGVDALQSGDVDNGESTELVTIVDGPGFLSFWWSVSSELNWDFLRFSIDEALTDEISGLVDWAEIRIPIPDGAHTLKWVYEKDPIFSVGADAGWVDQVVYVSADIEAPFITYHPDNQSVTVADPVTLLVQAFGEEPLTYQWEKDGVPVQVGSASELVFNNVTFGDSGRYRAVVSNAFGSTTSNEAVLDVFSSDPIGDALDLPGQTWTNVGSAEWFAQTIVSHDGVDAMQSGDIADNQTSIFTLSISGPLDLSFWWKASTEDFFDPLELLFDGVEQARLSGERDWHRQLVRIPQG